MATRTGSQELSGSQAFEVSWKPVHFQAAMLQDRFGLKPPIARLVAEHAFGIGGAEWTR
ncbi:hypothetical protein ACFSOZ_16290 [Mesorhizobium newzealandense]|uniref:Uncharacterized protein n=1 Tax=Mesorhizobium newzealandense TaxID=1300302 RepID=A0ABW4UAW5_9HYPH